MGDIESHYKDNMILGIYIIQDYHVVHANEIALDMFGYSLEEIKEVNITDLFVDKELIRNYVEKRMNKEVEHLHYRAIAKNRDEIKFLVEVHGIGTTYYNGRDAIIGTIINITEIYKERERLDLSVQQLKHLKSEILKSSNVLITDVSGYILEVNDKFLQMTGYTRKDVIGVHSRILNSGYHPKEFFKKMWDTILNGELWNGEIRSRRKNGEYLWVYATIIPLLDSNNTPYKFISLRDDITEKKEAELKVYQSEEKLRALIENSFDVIGITDENGTIIYENPTVQYVLGYTAEEVIGTNIFDYIHPEDILENNNIFSDILNKPNIMIRQDTRLRHKDGSWRHCEILVKNHLNNPYIKGITFNYRDITESKESEEKMKHMAYFDFLTNLPNRRSFEEKLEKELQQAKLNNNTVAIIFLDIDDFKFVNDVFGHDFGDQLLIEFSKRINTSFNPYFFSRLGGDEFALLMTNTENMEEVSQLASYINKLLEKPFFINQNEIYVTTSIGISMYPFAGDDLKTLLKNADIAMYQAKAQGKNTFEIYSRMMDGNKYKNFALRNDLRKALANDEFILEYQPRVNALNQKIEGAEALIRWIHPQWGRIPPDEFIPLAEESGFITKIGEWVIREVCAQINRWQLAGLPTIKISINFSSKQLVQPNIVELITDILEEFQVDPSILEIEITESTIIEYEERVLRTINRLHQLGINIALDDFGTGYSALNYLKKYKINILKIDKSIIQQIHSDDYSYEITNAIIQLARKLNIFIVAEGVETNQQKLLLEEMKCNQIQGYLFSKPVSIDQFAKLLETGIVSNV